jgi:hypothetical protein
MEYAATSHNRSVYASPPVGGSRFRSARSFATLIPTPHSTHILSALVFASQSPYTGRQNVVCEKSQAESCVFFGKYMPSFSRNFWYALIFFS